MLRFPPLRLHKLLPRLPILLALVAAASLSLKTDAQQAPAATPAPATLPKPPKSTPAKPRNRATAIASQQPAVPATPIVMPPAPPMPVWPANEQPQPAHVTWDSKGLKIEATNSSLSQILREVSTDTGAMIEGMGTDQRIFGTYGPGPAREVLSRLLDGSGYGVLMLGGEGTVPPSRVVLTMASPAGSKPQPNARSAAEEEDDEEADQPPPPEPPQPQPAPQEVPPQQPIRNPFGGPPRIPMPMGQQPPEQNAPQQNAPQQNAPQ